MSFQEDRDILIQYLSEHDLESEQGWEKFFQFIDELEEKASEEAQYFSLLADAYMRVGYNLYLLTLIFAENEMYGLLNACCFQENCGK